MSFAALVGAAALAAAALAPWPAAAGTLVEVEREVAAIEARLAQVDAAARAPDASDAIVAGRRFADAERLYLLGDWHGAAVRLTEAVDDATFRAGPDFAVATFYLADALRRQGACGSARELFRQYLALGDAERRGEAIAGALDCAVKERRTDAVDALVADAERAFGGRPPPEIAYLAAKATYHRTDLPAPERRERALAAFARVEAPFHLQAAYFQGVLLLETKDLAGALERFSSCAAAEPRDDRQGEVVELCTLAVGRVQNERGEVAAALDAYSRLPRVSPRFVEALYEIAWTFVRAHEYEEALRTTSLIVELAPESPVAPEATVLEGHLLLKLGRYGSATEAYNHVINTYAPVRDEIDAILGMNEDPVRYFNELVGRQGRAFDVAALLPPVAVRWASTQPGVPEALGLVSSLDEGRRELADAAALAERLDAILERADGVDAFPRLARGFAAAHAVENAAARAEGDLATAVAPTVARVLAPDRGAAFASVRARRAELEGRIALLPRTPADVEARLGRMRRRADDAERGAYQLGFVLDACREAIAGTERWVEDHRAEITADPEGRQEFAEELRTHAATVETYADDLRAIRQDIAKARDAAAGSKVLLEEARLRSAYLALVAEEGDFARAARPALPPADAALVDRAVALSARLAETSAGAREVEVRVAAEAREAAVAVRARVAGDKRALHAHAADLDDVQAEVKDVVGRIAFRSFGGVRAQFYRLVLEADVGIVDVAWARKRVRLDKIQQLSMQKAAEIRQLDEDFKGLLREVD